MRYFAVFWAKGEKDFFNFKALKPSLIILAIILKMIPMNSQIQISYNMFCSDLVVIFGIQTVNFTVWLDFGCARAVVSSYLAIVHVMHLKPFFS